MRGRIFGAILIMMPLFSWSTHIVGGEFEMVHKGNFVYDIRMIMYFDDVNGNPGAEDTEINVAIYRKSDNQLMQTITLLNQGSTFVPYSDPDCAIGELVTRRILYSITLSLSPSTYDDPDGYYMAYERCCRNNIINNIEEPDETGQTFYLEFPSIVKNGEPFYNSSPRLFPPLSDFGCVNQFYFVDFAGIDDDGDSLVYSLATPIRGTSTSTQGNIAPNPPRPAPYPLVTWQPGYDVNNMIKGNPPLSINKEGLLTVVPSEAGLFVFSVKCEEFRDGVKIGEVVRDFQMLVLNCPPPGNPPVIEARQKGDEPYHTKTLTVNFDDDTADEDRCVQFRVSDIDSQDEAFDFRQRISVVLRPVNFGGGVGNMLPSESTFILENDETGNFEICFDRCPPLKDGPFILDVIARDRTCPLPLMDTIRLTVNNPPPPNEDPFWDPPLTIQESTFEGVPLSWSLTGRDDDGDELYIELISEGFNMEDFGFFFEITSNTAGEIKAQVTWNPDCETYYFGNQDRFLITALLFDKDQCKFGVPDTSRFDLRILLPENDAPFISTNLNEPDFGDINRKILENLEFNVTATDPDGDHVSLELVGIGYDPAEYGMLFPKVEGTGAVTGNFSWDITCAPFSEEGRWQFPIWFVAKDELNKCRILLGDTLVMLVNIAAPDNMPPEITISSLNDLDLMGNKVEVTVGDLIELEFLGTDPDMNVVPDSLSLILTSRNGGETRNEALFNNAFGRGMVSSNFIWQPECNVFEKGQADATFTFEFFLGDDRCFNPKSMVFELEVLVKDIDAGEEFFLPPNVITPNGDNRNDFFALEEIDFDGHKVIDTGLPADNCQGEFRGIVIFNRWGKEMYSSTDRDFKWFADNVSAGVYFYSLRYSNRTYAGTIAVRF